MEVERLKIPALQWLQLPCFHSSGRQPAPSEIPFISIENKAPAIPRVLEKLCANHWDEDQMFLSHCITTSHFRIAYPVGVQLEHGICRKILLTNSLISESKFPAGNLSLAFSLFLCLSLFTLSLLSHQVVSDSLRPHGLQHARLPCSSPSPMVCPSESVMDSLFTCILLFCFPAGLDGKESACNVGDPVSIPGSGRFPWRRKWQLTPCSCLKNPINRGGWWAKVQEVAESWTNTMILLLWLKHPPG